MNFTLTQGIFQAIIYFICLVLVVYLYKKHVGYFRERIKAGVLNIFMASMFFLVISIGINMLISLWVRIGNILGGVNSTIESMQNASWTFSTFLMMTALVLLAYITHKNKYDLWIYLRKVEPAKEKIVQEVVQDYMDDNHINAETIHTLDDKNTKEVK